MRGYPARTWEEFVEHFRSRLRKSSRTWNGTCCLEWTGAIGKNGYGNIRYGGRWLRPHRLVWEIAHGPIPDGVMVLHHCDNRPCANELHLFAGTQKDNIDDMLSKKRGVNPPRHVGSKHPEAKLNELQVSAIKKQRSCGVHLKTLAKKYAVSHRLISQISRGEIWTHVPGQITKSASRRLNEQQVAAIRHARASGVRLKELAVQYSVSRQAISKISRGERQPNVPGPITKCKQGARS